MTLAKRTRTVLVQRARELAERFAITEAVAVAGCLGVPLSVGQELCAGVCGRYTIPVRDAQ